ncbi:hypothetical protein PRIPAC_81684 [Pristionchus pacificus]|uniref:Tyrosine phosphatase n=1 Tax=Pristionchus pacificus TaxID=54126 RepID=A0A2A6C414_PRIPA|nr:hypothetical protein PRIPAC_81684 [Pristionchus pacificus]|eukprot:PDM72847.1 tyrosine phosphatase [Pristionchus pacificus]
MPPPKRVSKRRKNKTTTDEGNTTTACATTTTADDDKRNTKKKTVSRTIQPGAEKVYERKKKTKTVEEKSVMMKSTVAPIAESKGSKEGNDRIPDPEDNKRITKGCDPEQLDNDQTANLKVFVEKILKTGVKALMDEYESMKSYELTPIVQKSFDANPDKNRYKDKVCIEGTRLRLQDSLNGDYIHANMVNNKPLLNKFIATQQGPLEKTIPDFWRMVVQENVGYIFMLCEFTELAKEKCAKYYPLTESEPMEHKGITIKLEKTTEDEVFVYSRLIVDSPGKGKRRVHHIKWKNWPDHGVPSNAMPALRLLRHARLCQQPTVVHCSAGVGRTGTLIAMEWLLQKICTTPPPYDMKEMIKWTRSQRAHAVQTSSQYVYIAFVVIRLIAEKDRKILRLLNDFQNEMQTLTGVKMDVIGPSKPTRK